MNLDACNTATNIGSLYMLQ